MILYRDERIHGETGASIRGLNARIKVQSEKRDSIRAQCAYRARASERVREIRFQLLPSESDFFSYLAETKFRVSTSIIRFRAGDI